jgi:acyl-CoA thioester hydrolase
MAEWTETNRGVVFPWQCDHYGHLNVRYYTHFFDDAGFQIWSLIGLKLDDIHARGVHPVVAQITVTFLHELKPGSLIKVKGGFTKAGTKSIGHTQRMYNVDTGVLCATQDSVEVFFDPETRTSAPMPDDIRARIAANLVDLNKE